MDPKTNGKASDGGAPAPILPPMYGSAEPLNAKAHGNLRILEGGDPRAAAALSNIVIGATEAPAAARTYPIVFSSQPDQPMPFVVTGVGDGRNAHVDADGRWRHGEYVPAYVRRHTFILLEEGDRLTLAIDRQSKAFSETTGRPLFEANGEPAKAALDAMEFCRAWRTELERTKKLVAQIAASGILVPRRADITLPDGRKTAVAGFDIVDEKKLAELSDEQFLELRRSGALALVYCHLVSMLSWRTFPASSNPQQA